MASHQETLVALFFKWLYIRLNSWKVQPLQNRQRELFKETGFIVTLTDRHSDQYVRDGGRIQQLCPIWIPLDKPLENSWREMRRIWPKAMNIESRPWPTNPYPTRRDSLDSHFPPRWPCLLLFLPPLSPQVTAPSPTSFLAYFSSPSRAFLTTGSVCLLLNQEPCPQGAAGLALSFPSDLSQQRALVKGSISPTPCKQKCVQTV